MLNATNKLVHDMVPDNLLMIFSLIKCVCLQSSQCVIESECVCWTDFYSF